MTLRRVQKKFLQACRTCHKVLETDKTVCPECQGNALTTEWFGYLVIIDSHNSDVAKKMNIKYNGRYALKVR
ncbi:MAG: DNA-directed RNA polymerase, subunit E'' [Methanocalculaceae archaeon]|jgi:DNA-directed RNA polymerase subunit E"|nr:DNA-directed RNA polymerase, subunit E'' [Methanocalculaceae archaeon]